MGIAFRYGVDEMGSFRLEDDSHEMTNLIFSEK